MHSPYSEVLYFVHRAYQPILPCGNKYRQLKWDKAKYEEHKKRIQTAKPLMDTNAPAIYSHHHLKLVKVKLKWRKTKLEIQRVNQENRATLDRITKSQPQYQVQQWHEDWQRAEKHMANIARYPHEQYKSQSRKEEQFKNQTPEQDRKREKQLKQEVVKSKTKEEERDNVHHGKRRNN